MGGQSLDETDPRASLWVSVDEKNNITVTIKKPKTADKSSTLAAKDGQIDWMKAKSYLLATTSQKIENAHVLPTKTTKYDQVIRLMDLLKQKGIKDVGLSPI